MNPRKKIKILHLDTNHPLLLDQLEKAGFTNEIDTVSTKNEIETKIENYQGVVLRSRIVIDKNFIDKAKNLQFIARVGAGLESIDVAYAHQKKIEIISSPEGNRNAVSEHTLGMLLGLMNQLKKADNEVRNNNWNRESNRGFELDGKTVGIIGYGNMGKAFAKKLSGFDCEVLFYDIKENLENEHAKQSSMQEIFEKAEVLSLHIPLTELTKNLVNKNFINQFQKPFWFINTARGKCVVTKDLVEALQSGKILGAGLDVLEYEKHSFETATIDTPEMNYLKNAQNVILTPHIAGWSVESKTKLAQVIVDKIVAKYFN